MVFLIATAGLVYELGMAAVASYVLGDSVRQFSIVIGVYLSALGLGAYLSRFLDSSLAQSFVKVELATALLGGLSAPGLFLAFSLGGSFELLLLLVVTTVGTLVGIELPLLMRILENRLSFKDLVARSLTFDYAGCLLGSLAFSLLLVPKLGLSHTSLLCGVLNAVVGLASTWLFRDALAARKGVLARLRLTAIAVIAVLLSVAVVSERLIAFAESRLYGTQVTAIDTPYQRILLLQREGSQELYLNGHLQFSSLDECRYHEALVHPAMSASPHPNRIFIGGGGDGLALREVLKWPAVEHVTLVDLDPVITQLSSTNPRLTTLNQQSLLDPRVAVKNEDAFQWIARDPSTYDVLILDFPDPTTLGVGKLFSTTFYAQLKRLLAPGAAVVVQATSPHTTRQSFWSIHHTISQTGYQTQPIRIFLPSFGDWGFVLAKTVPLPQTFAVPDSVQLHCLQASRLDLLALFPNDASPIPGHTNRLDNQSLVQGYLEEAARFE